MRGSTLDARKPARGIMTNMMNPPPASASPAFVASYPRSDCRNWGRSTVVVPLRTMPSTNVNIARQWRSCVPERAEPRVPSKPFRPPGRHGRLPRQPGPPGRPLKLKHRFPNPHPSWQLNHLHRQLGSFRQNAPASGERPHVSHESHEMPPGMQSGAPQLVLSRPTGTQITNSNQDQNKSFKPN